MDERKQCGGTSLDYRVVFDASPIPCAVLSTGLAIVDVNSAYLALFKTTRESLLGRNLFDALPSRLQEASRELRASFLRVIEGREPNSIPLLRYPMADDHKQLDRYWTVNNTPLFDPSGDLIGILNCPVELSVPSFSETETSKEAAVHAAFPVDVRGINQHLEREQRRFRQLMQQAPGFVAVGRSPIHIFELANNAYFQLVGHRDIIGKPVREALPELAGQGFFELLDHVYGTGEPFIGRAMPIQVQLTRAAPLVERYIDFIYQPILDEDGKVSGIFVQGHDVTEAHQLSQTVAYQAAHDPLTGLINRREFDIRLYRAVEEIQDGRGPHSLVYLDLDQFKVVNDICGHAAGDELLRQVSRQLQKVVPTTHTVARLGGDEFAILLTDVGSGEAERLAEQLRRTIDDLDFSWERRLFGCSASLGVVILDETVGDAAQSLSAADSACFMAKDRGRNRVQVYCASDRDLASRRRDMDWVSRLKEALATDQFELYGQKILPTQKTAERPLRLELLLRLRDRDGSMVSPMAFIPAAERFGIMPTIDRWVIRTAFKRLASLPAKLLQELVVSINLSGTTLGDERILAFILDELGEQRSLASHICFEITETAAVQQLSKAAELMRQLRAIGFQFALDDFGSGMSSMSYLKQLPVDHLKIDGAFIRQIRCNAVDAAMVEAMAKVASVMGIQTIAEYVDDETTRSMLERLHIDYVQGFGTHVPEPLEDLLGALLNPPSH